jgi:hypothetical protein
MLVGPLEAYALPHMVSERVSRWLLTVYQLEERSRNRLAFSLHAHLSWSISFLVGMPFPSFVYFDQDSRPTRATDETLGALSHFRVHSSWHEFGLDS